MSTKSKKTISGSIAILRPDRGPMRRWKYYKFQSTAMYLLYFKTDNPHKPDGEILLPSITRLETEGPKGSTFPLQIHFSGKPGKGAISPWVLDFQSNEERIEWMEVIKPGSSALLQKFSKSGSLHRSPPLSSPGTDTMYNPYSVADDTYVSSDNPRPAMAADYIDPIELPTSPGRKESNVGPDSLESDQRYVQSGSQLPVGSQSACILGSDRVTSPTNISSTYHGNHHPTSHSRATNGKADHSRSMIVHSPREHSKTALSRASTERKHPKSPDHHLYEMDHDKMPLPPPPSKAPPQPWPRHVKGPPPRLNTKSPPMSATTEHEYCLLDEEYVYSDQVLPGQEGKEPEYDCPIVPSKSVPVPRPRTKPVNSSANYPADQSRLKPQVQPRKNQKSSNQLSMEQPDYLDLMGGGNAEHNTPKTANGSSFETSAEISQYVFDNFNEDQADTLIRMLQQVQNNGIQQKQGAQVSHPTCVTDRTQQRKSFERVISYTPSLEAEKILVTDDDDGEGYEARPDWAKAVGLQKSTTNHFDPDLLTDLEEEALHIPCNKLTDFVVIGEGQFGKVFRASMQRGSESVSVAVKTAKKNTSPKEQAEFHKEMKVMSQMVHPNIVQLYGVAEDAPVPWIILEYLKNGDIKNFLTKNDRPTEKLVKYMIDVSMGMHYLSERGLVHRDLAARNVLVGDNETCKVSDFGLLRELPKDDSIYHMQTNVPCPVRWMPPESISDRKFSPASDVWSFGVLQWEMFYPNKTPYGKLGNLEVAMKIMQGHRLDIPYRCPPLVSRIMKACWHHEPDRRPSFLLISTLLTTKVTYCSDKK